MTRLAWFGPSMFDDLPPLPEALPADHARQYIPSGYAGTAQTIELIRKAVTLGKRDFSIRSLASSNLQHCTHRDFYCQAQAQYDWVIANIKYVYDPNGVELIVHPAKVVEIRAGDCDDMVGLLCALWESIGLRSQLVTIKGDTTQPENFTHIYAQVMIPGKGWVGADATMRGMGFGWEPPAEYERAYWPGSNDKPEIHEGEGMSGLSGLGYTGNQVATLFQETADYFRGQVASRPESQGSATATLTNSIVSALSRFERSWLPKINTQPDSAMAALQGIIININTLVASLNAAGADVDPVPVPVVEVVGTVPPDSMKWLIFGGIALGAVLLLTKGKR